MYREGATCAKPRVFESFRVTLGYRKRADRDYVREYMGSTCKSTQPSRRVGSPRLGGPCGFLPQSPP